MPRQTAQPIRDAPTFLTTRDISDIDPEFVESWQGERTSRALLHAALQRHSDFTFVASLTVQLADALDAEGVNQALAARLVADVLAAPSFSVKKSDGELEHVRQAVIFGRDDSNELPLEMLVTLDSWILPRHTPEGERVPVAASVQRSSIEVTILDMEGDAQLGDVMRTYLGWLQEFPLPTRTARDLEFSVVFLGAPAGLGALDVPDQWRQQLTNLASAFGVDAAFHHGPSFTGAVGDKVRQVIRFDPWKGEAPVTSEGVKLDATTIDVRHLPFDDVYQLVAVALASHVVEEEASAFERRDLNVGEELFHRKVGSNRRYDNFDVGATTPCKHGRASFVRWSGPKATKGMEHRYSNFVPEWLHHCKKYPNCGVYAVFNPGASEQEA